MNGYQRLACILAVPALLGTGCGGVSTADIEFASLKDAISLHQSLARSPRAALFIDARAPKYFEEGHIPGAANYQLYDFRQKDTPRASIETFDELIVYGDNPGSPEAEGLTKRLMAIGYSEVRLFAGGLMEWRAAGLPVEQGAQDKALPEQ